MTSVTMSRQTSAFAVLLLLYLSSVANAEKLSDYRLCADRTCETRISQARTLAKHKSNDPAFLSFERGQMLNIYSKSAGNRQDLWGGEYNGKRGYFPRSFVREHKVEIPNPQHVVETEHHVSVEERVLGKHVPVRKQEDKLAQHTRQAAQPEQNVEIDKPRQTERVEASDDKSEDKQTQTEAGETVRAEQDVTAEQSGQDTQEPVEENKQETDETEIEDETEVSEEEEEQDSLTDSEADKKQTDEKKQPEKETFPQAKEDDDTEIKEDETEIDEDETELAESDGEDEEEENEVNDVNQDEMLKDQAADESIETLKNDVDETELKEQATNDETEMKVEEEQGSMFSSLWSADGEGKINEAEDVDTNLVSHGEPVIHNHITDQNTTDDYNVGDGHGNGSVADNLLSLVDDPVHDSHSDNVRFLDNLEHNKDSGVDIDTTDQTYLGEVKEDKDLSTNGHDQPFASDKNADTIGGKELNNFVSDQFDFNSNQDGVNSKTDDVFHTDSKSLPLDEKHDNSNEDILKANDIEGSLHLKQILKSSYEREHDGNLNENIDKQSKGLENYAEVTKSNDEYEVEKTNNGVDPHKEKSNNPNYYEKAVDDEKVDEGKVQDKADTNKHLKLIKDITEEREVMDDGSVIERGVIDKEFVVERELLGNNERELADAGKNDAIGVEDENRVLEEQNVDKELVKADNIWVSDQKNGDEKQVMGNVEVTNGGNIDFNKEPSYGKQESGIQSENLDREGNLYNNEVGNDYNAKKNVKAEEGLMDLSLDQSGFDSLESESIMGNENKLMGSINKPVDEVQQEVETDMDFSKEMGAVVDDGLEFIPYGDASKVLNKNESDVYSNASEEQVITEQENEDKETGLNHTSSAELEASSQGQDTLPDDTEQESVEPENETEEKIAKQEGDYDEVLTETGAVLSPFKGGEGGESPEEAVAELTDEVKAKQQEEQVNEIDTESVKEADIEKKSDSDQMNQGSEEVEIVKIREGEAGSFDGESNKEIEDKALEQFEKVMETMASNNNVDQELGQESENEDLKFINEQGETVEDKANLPTETDGALNVQEMELPSDISGQELQASIHEEYIDEAMLSNFDKLASGISILASQTVSESVEDITPSSTENFVETPNTNINDVKEVTYSTLKDAETLYDSLYDTIVSKESEISATVGEHVETVHDKVDVNLNEELGTELPVTDENAGSNAYVIDGTTFDADYFEEGTTTLEATPLLKPTSVVMDTSVYTPTDTFEPTRVHDISSQETKTVTPRDLLQDYEKDPNMGSPDIDVQELTEGLQNSDDAQVPNYSEIQPTASIEDVSIELSQATSDSVQILGSTFSYVTESDVDSLPVEDTKPMDDIKVTMDTEMLQNNETVASDNVQKQIQPSMDQNSYITDQFLSRKPLSDEPTTGNEPATVDVTADIQDVTDDIQDVTAEAEKVFTDENNNIDNTMVPDVNGKIEPGYESTTPGLSNPYDSGEHVYSRKVPDPELDEEVKQSGVGLMKMLEPYLKSMINVLPPSMQTVLEQEPLGMSPTMAMFVTMVSTNAMALLLIMGCMCKGKKKSAGKKDPVVVIRGLEEELFLATKEKENLEDDLQVKSKKILELEQEMANQQNNTGSVETDLKTIKLHNESLKKQLSEQKEELDELKEESVENSHLIATKDALIHNYHAEVQSLGQRAHDAELALQKTSHGLSDREEELRVSLEQVQSLSEQVQYLETRKQQLQDEAVDWSEKVKELTEQVEQFTADSRRMQEDLAFKESELEVLRDCFLQVKAFQGEEEMKEETEQSPDLSEKLNQMMNVSRVNASLRAVEEERDVVQNKLVIEVESRKELEDQVQLLKRKIETNQTDKMKAERQGQEAQTKLEVLSKYFKEKETELTRQLGEQEVLKNQNISKLQSSDSITQELAKENDVYRQQIDDLKTEITKAERDFRSQIAANEKKAHENWIATRAAERELKESRHECGMLRQKLTDLERKLMQGPPPGLIRPITHRAMPPPGMLNGPPPPPPDRPGSRGDDDYRASPVGPERMPPPNRRHLPGPPGARPPPPPLDAMSPPPFAIRPPFPPDRRSPPSFDRYPPARGPRPPFPRPPPPHLRSPPPSEHDDSMQGQYSRIPPPPGRDRGTTHHQSQV